MDNQINKGGQTHNQPTGLKGQSSEIVHDKRRLSLTTIWEEEESTSQCTPQRQSSDCSAAKPVKAKQSSSKPQPVSHIMNGDVERGDDSEYRDSQSEAEEMPKGRKVKRPRKLVYCTTCNHRHSKEGVLKYAARQGKEDIALSGWKRKGTDSYVPIAQDCCEICAFDVLIKYARSLGYPDQAEQYADDQRAYKKSVHVKKIQELEKKKFAFHRKHGHFPREITLNDIGPIALGRWFFGLFGLPAAE